MNRVEPAHVPGCLKMFKTTGSNREGCQIPWKTGTTPGATMSQLGWGRGDTGAIREHPCLHRDKPCALKTPGMPAFSTMWYVPTAIPQISLRLGVV